MANRFPANGLAEMLVPEAIDVNLQAASKIEVLEKLCRLLAPKHLAWDEAAILQAVLAREQAGSTGCGSGVAVPHARVPGLDRLYLAIGLVKPGLDFGAVDGQPVKIFFLIVAPQNASEAYLKLLSHIAQRVKEEEFRSALLDCAGPLDVIELLRAV